MEINIVSFFFCLSDFVIYSRNYYEILSLQILSHFITNFRRFKFIISLLNFTLLF